MAIICHCGPKILKKIVSQCIGDSISLVNKTNKIFQRPDPKTKNESMFGLFWGWQFLFQVHRPWVPIADISHCPRSWKFGSSILVSVTNQQNNIRIHVKGLYLQYMWKAIFAHARFGRLQTLMVSHNFAWMKWTFKKKHKKKHLQKKNNNLPSWELSHFNPFLKVHFFPSQSWLGLNGEKGGGCRQWQSLGVSGISERRITSRGNH